MLKIGIALLIGFASGALTVILAENSALRETHTRLESADNMIENYVKLLKSKSNLIDAQRNKIKNFEYLLNLKEVKADYACTGKGKPKECKDTCCSICGGKEECDYKWPCDPRVCGHAVRKC